MRWPYESQSFSRSPEKLISALLQIMKNCRDHFRTWSKFNGVYLGLARGSLRAKDTRAPKKFGSWQPMRSGISQKQFWYRRVPS